MTNKPLQKDEIKVEIDGLCMGMFLISLDIPWSATPFMFEGFLLTNDRQLTVLRDMCKWAIVSKSKSKHGLFEKEKPAASATPAAAAPTRFVSVVVPERETRNGVLDSIGISVNSVVGELFSVFNLFKRPLKENYHPEKALKSPQAINAAIKEDFQKIAKAKQIRTQFKNDEGVSSNLVNHVVTKSIIGEAKHAVAAQTAFSEAVTDALSTDLNSSELHATIDVAKEAIESVVESITRNPDAMQLVTKIKTLDHDSYQHALDVSLMMIAFGRELCLPKNDLVEIGLGGLLHDVGEIKQPEGMPIKRIKNITKFKIYKDHVEEGTKISTAAGYSHIVKQIISNHHEYYDGTGYPRGISKGQLGLYGNMIVIVDTYISLTTGRNCDIALPPNKALEVMHKQRSKFHPQLFDQFIQVIGLYPVGSTVKLSSGDVGFVIKQNKAWRLKPVVMVVMDKNEKKLDKPIHIDLQENKKPLHIVKELSSERYNLRATDYLMTGT